MIMTDEQFKKEIFHRRDQELKRRQTRKRVVLSVVPVVCVFLLSVFLLDLTQPFEKNTVLEDGGVFVEESENTITYADGTKKELKEEAVDWLIENTVNEVSAGNAALGATDLRDDADDAVLSETENIVISFSYQGEIRRVILNEHGLYLESTGRFIMPYSELTEFLKMMD